MLKSGIVQIGKYASATNKPVTSVPSTDTDTNPNIAAGRRNGVILDASTTEAVTGTTDDAPRTNVGEFQDGDTQAVDAGTGPSNYVEVPPANNGGKKICPACTYENEPDHAFCLGCFADLA